MDDMLDNIDEIYVVETKSLPHHEQHSKAIAQVISKEEVDTLDSSLQLWA